MRAQPGDQRQCDARGGLAVAHDPAEHGAGDEQQEKFAGEGEGPQRAKGKIFGDAIGNGQAIGQDDDQRTKHGGEDDVDAAHGKPDQQRDAAQ